MDETLARTTSHMIANELATGRCPRLALDAGMSEDSCPVRWLGQLAVVTLPEYTPGH